MPTLVHSFIFGSDFARQFSLLVENIWSSQNNPDFNFQRNNCNIDSLYTLDYLSSDHRMLAQAVIDSFKEVSSDSRLGRTNKISMHIDTGDAKPFKKKQYPMSPYMLKTLNKELDEMLELGVVEPSNSPYYSPVLLVKKANGEMRFCFEMSTN